MMMVNAQSGKWTKKGDAAYTAGKYSKAATCYQKGIKAGEDSSWYGLGVYYHNGKDDTRDDQEAAYCFYRAALAGVKGAVESLLETTEHNNADAWMLAGHCYQMGYGVEQDLQKAINCYKQQRRYNLSYLIAALQLSLDEAGDAEQNSVSSALQSKPDTSGKEIFRVTGTPPEFPGGMQALVAMMAQTAVYPEYCRLREITGTVLIEFVVEPDGQVGHAKVVLSCFPLLDNEALRVVNKQPRWKPGLWSGRPVRCYFSVPMRFSM
jgi:TonB family protein